MCLSLVVKPQKIIGLTLLLKRKCGSHSWAFCVLLSHISSLCCPCVHVQIIHILFWNIFIFRSAVVWSWWISLPRSCDLYLPELAVWWGPWLPWWFRRVFRCLWVERFSCHLDLPYMWNWISVVLTDDCCSSWFFFFSQTPQKLETFCLCFLKGPCKWEHNMQFCSMN